MHTHMHTRSATLPHPPLHACQVDNPAAAAASCTSTCMPSWQPCHTRHTPSQQSCRVTHIHMHMKSATPPQPPRHTYQVSKPATATMSCESATPPQPPHRAHQVSKPTIASRIAHVHTHVKLSSPATAAVSCMPTHTQHRQPDHSCRVAHVHMHLKSATPPRLPRHAHPHTCKVGNPATAATLHTPTPMQSWQAPSCHSL
jgi:hypothetical protein